MKTLVAGSTGLVGSAIVRALKESGQEVIEVSSKIVDLTNREATFNFLQEKKPDLVIDAAAKVGGIGANNSLPVDFLSVNLQIQTNLMDAAHAAQVEKFIFLGSSCIYPRQSPQPIKEEYLLTGPLESTNSAYALAKIAGIELIKSYRKQYGHKWISLMPTNLYGPNDNFDLESSHVLPALINRFVTAVDSGIDKVTLWGSGQVLREFLHVDDLAQAVITAGEKYDGESHLNIGSGKDLTIQALAELISKQAGFNGKINWDRDKPDGTPRKVLDISRIRSLGWEPKISLNDGITQTIDWYRKNRALQ